METHHLAPGRQLPRNYLPMALAYLRGDDSRDRSLFDVSALESGEFGIVTAAQIADPLTMPDSQGRPMFLGPPVVGGSNLKATPMDFRALRTKAVAGIVDIGTAFWHPRFRVDGRSAFVAVNFIEFLPSGMVKTTTLNDTQIYELCGLYDRKGNVAVLAHLARKFPGSIYGWHGSEPGLASGELAHGTAIADRIAGCGEPPDMVAVELPAAACFDRSGDVLRIIIAQSVARAVDLLGNLAADLHIAAPYAYLGGPSPQASGQGPADPLHEALERVLATEGRSDRLYLPMGNFLMSAQHARLGDLSPADPPASLIVQCAANDPTGTTLEIHWRGASKVSLLIKDPNDRQAKVEVDTDQVYLFGQKQKPVVALHALSAAGWQSLRVSIAPTISRGAPSARPGQWQFSLCATEEMEDLHAFVLRNDPPGHIGRPRASYQARLIDPGYRTPLNAGITAAFDDPGTGAPPIRRQGPASHLVLGDCVRRRAVAAVERAGGGGATRPAPYSAPQPGGQTQTTPIEMPIGSIWRPGLVCLMNGANSYGRLAGTSVAVAEAIRRKLSPSGT